MDSEFRTFRELDCWKRCRELRHFVAKVIVPGLLKSEERRLGDQILRAARSTTANVAEGHGRYYYLNNAEFCRNARGSCSEVLDHLITALDEELIGESVFREGETRCVKAICVLNGYIRYLSRSAGRT